MECTLYINKSDNNTINKDLEIIGTYYIVNKAVMDVENPTIILSYDGDIDKINYCYIDDFNRYYFAKTRALNGNLVEIVCSVDGLESFKDAILNTPCIVEKQASLNVGSKYFNDGSWNVLCKDFLQSYNFPNGFNDDGEFILITCGG